MKQKDKRIQATAKWLMENTGHISKDWVKNNGLEDYVIPANK